MLSGSSVIPLKTIKLNDYYIKNFVSRCSADQFSLVQTKPEDELAKRRFLRKMQSQNIFQRAVLRLERLFQTAFAA